MAKSFKSKYGKLTGTSYEEVLAAARREYHVAQKRTPRRVAHVRSKYFNKDKIFINLFWEHLKSKRSSDQFRRLKLYVCALDLLRNTVCTSDTIFDKSDANSILHRFYGQTKDGEYFVVQVKQDKRTGRKDFMSVFPSKRL